MNTVLHGLIADLHHPDKNVRGKAAVSIGKLDDHTTVNTLLEALVNEPDMYVREDITWALVRLQDVALPALIQLVDDDKASTRHLAVHVLGKIGGAQVLDVLIHALDDSDAAVISKAAFGLAQIGDIRAVPALVRLVGCENREVETMLMNVLERFGTAPVQPLINLMASDRWQVREQAADILGQIGDPAARLVLIAALNDTVWQVRFAAVTALSHMGGVEAKVALLALPDDENDRVRELVSKLVKRMK